MNTQLNIAPRGQSWVNGKLIDGTSGHPTRESSAKADAATTAKLRAFIGINPAGFVNTVSIMDPVEVMEALMAGETIVPCALHQARALFGETVMQPIDLDAAIARGVKGGAA